MFRERIVTTALVAILGLTLMGLFRPDSPDPLEDVQAAKSRFFINKANNTAKYDMVIVGDSRALRDLAPEVLQEKLPGTRIYNLAFHAGGLNPQMYGEAEKLLSPESHHQGIIIAPTALAFLPHKKSNSQFMEYRHKPRDLVWLYKNHPGVPTFFQPVSPSVFIRRWFDIKPKSLLFQDFRSTGWIATNQTPRDDVSDFSTQEEILSNYTIDRSLVDELMEQTRTWTSSGIAVFGLFPPAYPPRVAFEDSVLAFDKASFIKTFEESGGHWLDVGNNDFFTYDGSHLEEESSIRLSEAIGQAIAGHAR